MHLYPTDHDGGTATVHRVRPAARRPRRGRPAPSQPPAPGHDVAAVFAEAAPALTACLYRLLGNRDDARDAAQTVFLKCWRTRDRLGAVRDPRGWLFRVAFNVATDCRRRGRRRAAVPLEALGDTVPERSALTAEGEALRRERLDLLRAALGDLRPGERAVFVLRLEVALTYEAIAAARGQPVGTVKTLMRAALRKLRHRLADHRAGEGPHRSCPT